MSQIMKSFLGVFLILLMAVISASLLGGFLQVMAAQNVHSQVIAEMENSNYSPSVLKQCLKNAADTGYVLSVDLYDEGGKNYHMSSEQVDTSLLERHQGEIKGGKVEMNFQYEVGFLGISETRTLVGYAM